MPHCVIPRNSSWKRGCKRHNIIEDVHTRLELFYLPAWWNSLIPPFWRSKCDYGMKSMPAGYFDFSCPWLFFVCFQFQRWIKSQIEPMKNLVKENYQHIICIQFIRDLKQSVPCWLDWARLDVSFFYFETWFFFFFVWLPGRGLMMACCIFDVIFFL